MSENLYSQAISNMSATVDALSNRIPPPKEVPFGDSFVYRYTEQTIHQAIVQKLARYVSTLQAAFLLMEVGFVQEQAALQRVLDEIQEDVTFLSYAVIFGELTAVHKAYLAAFYAEEYDASTGEPANQDRASIPRRKIRAAIANIEGLTQDPSGAVKVTRQVSKTYSGYVHAASPQIMDMYFGSPPAFQMHGMKGTQRQSEHREDIWNYFYRGLLAFSTAGKAFGDDQLFDRIHEFALMFADAAGRNYRKR